MKKITFIIFWVFGIIALKAQNLNLQWAGAIGSTQEDLGNSLVADALGNIFITGSFQGTVDFDPGPGTFTLSSNGGNDIFVAKYGNTGNLIWADQIGSAYNSDNGNCICLDGAGNILLTGVFGGTVDFDPGAGTYTVAASGSYNSYIAKIDGSGNFVWAKTIVGSGPGAGSVGFSVKTDVNNNVYSTGWFQSTADFDPGPGTSTVTTNGFQDIYVLKLDPSGNMIWAKQIGGSNSDDGLSISLDASGNVHVTGFYNTTVDFDPGPGNSSLAANGGYEVFVLKLDAAGNFVWAKSLGGSGMEEGKSVKVDASGNVYTSGFFNGVADFDPGPSTFTLDAGTGSDIFISKLDASGNFVWAKQFTSASACEGNAIALDNSGNIYATGFFDGTTDFDPSVNTNTLLTAGSLDIYLFKLNPAGNLVWTNQLGGTLNDVGYDVFVNSSGFIFCTGGFQGTGDFDPGPGVTNLVAASTASHDVFVVKMSETPTGMLEQSMDNEIIVFPNPSSDKVNFFGFTGNISGFKMFDGFGQIVLEGTNNDLARFSVNIANQSNGVYYIEIVADAGVIRKKIIKN